MRRIDLMCLIASPIIAGLLLTYGGLQMAILGIVAWNLLAWLPECLLLKHAQQLSPALMCATRMKNKIRYLTGSSKICVGTPFYA